jgi:hypothetical protein
MKASPDPDALVLNKQHTGRQKPSSLSHQFLDRETETVKDSRVTSALPTRINDPKFLVALCAVTGKPYPTVPALVSPMAKGRPSEREPASKPKGIARQRVHWSHC